MATFILKVNSHAAFPAFPTDPWEWEGNQFFSPSSRGTTGSNASPPMPMADDRVHVWINERGGGGGYTGYGEVLQYFGKALGKKNPTFEFRLRNARLLPAPIKGNAFWKHEADAEAIQSIRRYTLRQLLWLNEAQASDFEAALQKIVSQIFGEDHKCFVGKSSA